MDTITVIKKFYGKLPPALEYFNNEGKKRYKLSDDIEFFISKLTDGRLIWGIESLEFYGSSFYVFDNVILDTLNGLEVQSMHDKTW